MRYRFNGITRQGARPVTGHVAAVSEEEAYEILSDNDVLTSSLEPAPWPDPAQAHAPPAQAPQLPTAKPANPKTPAATPAVSAHPDRDFTQALENAIDASSRTVHFDAFAQQFTGQQVRIISHDKIRQQIMQIIDTAIQQSTEKPETRQGIRDRIAHAVERMFKDQRNLTREAPAPPHAPPYTHPQTAQQPSLSTAAASQPAPAQGHVGPAQVGTQAEPQGNHLAELTRRMEDAVAKLETLVQRGGVAGMGGRGEPVMPRQREQSEENRAVLHEILETNRELRRIMNEKTSEQVNESA